MPHRVFSSERTEREAISFGFGGKTFRCIPEMPWPLLEEILGKVPVDARGQVDSAHVNAYGLMLQVGPFFRQIIVDEDLPTFEEVLRSKEDPVSIRALMEIMTWLVEEYVGRPTDRPGSSHPGPSTPETKSRVVSLQRGTVEEVG